MSEFEYLAIAFSLLYSLAALRIIDGWSAAMSADSRSLHHLALSFIQLFLVAVSFWVFFSLRQVEWTFLGFLIALLIPGTLYYCSTVLMPAEPGAVEDWGAFHLEARRRWYLGLAAWGLSAALSATVNLGMGLVHPARVVHVAALAIGVTGAASRSNRAHNVLLALMILLTIVTVAAQVPAFFLVE